MINKYYENELARKYVEEGGSTYNFSYPRNFGGKKMGDQSLFVHMVNETDEETKFLIYKNDSGAISMCSVIVPASIPSYQYQSGGFITYADELYYIFSYGESTKRNNICIISLSAGIVSLSTSDVMSGINISCVYTNKVKGAVDIRIGCEVYVEKFKRKYTSTVKLIAEEFVDLVHSTAIPTNKRLKDVDIKYIKSTEVFEGEFEPVPKDLSKEAEVIIEDIPGPVPVGPRVKVEEPNAISVLDGGSAKDLYDQLSKVSLNVSACSSNMELNDTLDVLKYIHYAMHVLEKYSD